MTLSHLAIKSQAFIHSDERERIKMVWEDFPKAVALDTP